MPVAASTHRWSGVEDDEEEEAEFEKLFLDGLEDLAKDNIRRKQFEKAVTLITQAMQRKDKAGFGRKDVRRLQSLLALCHFFRDDWNQAEPIVSNLAKSEGSLPMTSLDPVIWTMLHALALAYLSTYAFDSALTMCKRAMQAQRKWAKSMRMDRQKVNGWAETTGLLATIFDMEGDYIAAEIYRRQLPQHFVYCHCWDPREFLARQSHILEEVLGNDLPDLCDYFPVQQLRGLHELDGSTQSPSPLAPNTLPRRPTIVRKTRTIEHSDDMSPLRAVHQQWEKYEMDTTKEVAVPRTRFLGVTDDSDADDEATPTSSDSPCNPNGIGRFRMRATRVFGTQRGQSQIPSGGDAHGDSGASQAVSPIRRWFQGANIFAAKPSRTVLRKRPRNDTNTGHRPAKKHGKKLRVTHVQFIGSSTFGSSGSPSTHSASRAYPKNFLPDSRPGVLGKALAPFGAPTDFPGKPGNSLAVRGGVLDASRVPHIGPRREPPTSQTPEAPARSVARHAEELANTTSAELADTSFSCPGIRRTPAQLDLLHTLRRRPSSTLGREAHPNQDTADLADLSEAEEICIPEGRHKLRRAAPQHHPATAAVLPDEQATTLTRLAGLLASLPATRTWGADELSATRHELEALSACLERWSPDTILRLDLQSIIKSLPSKVIEPDEGRDSGYDPMDDESSNDDALFDGEWQRLVTGPEDLEPQASHGLEHQINWVTGMDATYLQGLWSLQSPTPHSKNNSHLRKFGKHAERFAGKDPSGGLAWKIWDSKITERVEIDGREISKGKNDSRATVVRHIDEAAKSD
jgi:hypothetical protein